MNTEFQRIARRDKKAFLSEQCKEIEGNNRTGKTRYLFKKIRDTKGTFHVKMGTTKGTNCMALTEAGSPGSAAESSYLTPEVSSGERSYFTSQVRGGGQEE